MSPLAALALRYGLPKWVIVLLGSLALLALVAGGAGVWLHLHDKRVVANDRAGTAIDVLKGDAKANDKAAETRREDDARLSTETRELEKVTEHAKDDPAAARQRYYDCIRLQQSARARGVAPPSC